MDMDYREAIQVLEREREIQISGQMGIDLQSEH
jgi:hypothetical protein